jgi:regulator of protease activity HflC (stomatin/prohibitin superfamily)
MTRPLHSESEGAPAAPVVPSRLRRLALAIGVPLVGLLLFALILWHAFFTFVPPGHVLVVIAKNGEPLDPDEVLARPGQKGIQKDVLGEGWHFVMPIAYTTELKKNIEVPPGQVGIVVSKGGPAPTNGRELAEEAERGIRPDVLPPGSYRLNPYGYDVELVPATEIKPGYVGVLRRLLGRKNAGVFANDQHDKGILRDVLQPGLYYLNTKAYEVIHCEVGIDQSSFREKHKDGEHAITFQVKDGYTISMECTIEWEVLPRDAPALAAEFGTERQGDKTVVDFHAVERNVIDQHVRKISRDRGFNFGAQDFLEGANREVFQSDFTRELERVCGEKNVKVRSAFIRAILIPDAFLEQKRMKQMAIETKITNEAKELTAASDAEVEREKTMVDQAVAKVKAETKRLVAGIERETENVKSRNEAEIEALKADYGARIALLDAERKTVLGGAEAEATRLRETARSALYKLKMDVFGNDGAAYLRYALAQQLNPKLVLRLFHSGPGTLWTNMDHKNLNLLLPAPGAAPAEPGQAGAERAAKGEKP